MKKKSSFSGTVLILIILFGLSLALNLVQLYFQPLPASCTIREVCPPSQRAG